MVLLSFGLRASMPMIYAVHENDAETHVTLTGSLGFFDLDTVKTMLADVAKTAGERVVLDLKGVKHGRISSLAILSIVDDRLSACGRRMVVANPPRGMPEIARASETSSALAFAA